MHISDQRTAPLNFRACSSVFLAQWGAQNHRHAVCIRVPSASETPVRNVECKLFEELRISQLRAALTRYGFEPRLARRRSGGSGEASRLGLARGLARAVGAAGSGVRSACCTRLGAHCPRSNRPRLHGSLLFKSDAEDRGPLSTAKPADICSKTRNLSPQAVRAT